MKLVTAMRYKHVKKMMTFFVIISIIVFALNKSGSLFTQPQKIETPASR